MEKQLTKASMLITGPNLAGSLPPWGGGAGTHEV